MSDQDMAQAIINAIQQDANLLIVMRAAITAALVAGGQPTVKLQTICQALGISTT